jgi:hypothetical protein
MKIGCNRVHQHLGRERARLRRERGHVPGGVAVEPLDRGVEVAHPRVGGLHRRARLCIDAGDGLGVEHAVDDHRAAGLEHLDDGVRTVGGIDVVEHGGLDRH